MLSEIMKRYKQVLWHHKLMTQSLRCTLHTTPSCEAARKGTREKARKKKVKVEVKKVGFIPHNQRDKKTLLERVNKHLDDSWKKIAKDDCYVAKFYRRPIYTVQEAIQCHRETHHPSMYNVPHAPLLIDVELNMRGEKSTRFVDNFQRMALVPHKFDHCEDRRILVFSKSKDDIPLAREAGATLVGGSELIKDITNGEIMLSDYQYIIAHTNILAELVVLRGLMKRKFPSPKTETLGTNLLEMIKRYSDGINYTATKDEYQQDYGLISTCIGPLNMDSIHLEENLSYLLKDINTMRPKREGRFVTRVFLKCPPSGEHLKIDPFVYISELHHKSSNSESENISSAEKQTNNFSENSKIALVN